MDPLEHISEVREQIVKRFFGLAGLLGSDVDPDLGVITFFVMPLQLLSPAAREKVVTEREQITPEIEIMAAPFRVEFVETLPVGFRRNLVQKTPTSHHGR